MKLSEGTESSLHCVVGLAMIPVGAVVPAKALAEFHGVSASYLLKHLQALSVAKVLKTMPGPLGGYRLNRSANEITVLDVVQAVEGTTPAFRCMEIRQRGPCVGPPSAYRVPCAINQTMLRAEAAWRDALQAQTIAMLVHEQSATAHAPTVRCAESWVKGQLRFGKESKR